MADWIRTPARTLRRWTSTPVLTGAAATSLALGIATVTVLYAFLDAALLRPLPGTDARGLVRVQSHDGHTAPLVVSHSEFEAIRDRTGVFSALVAERTNTAVVAVDGVATTVGASAVSREFFRVVGADLAHGTGFGPGRGAPEVVVSYGFWRSKLLEDPSVLGRVLRIGPLDVSVVGVAEPGFNGAFPGFRTDIWVPLEYVEQVFPGDGRLDRMGDRFLNLLGTVRPGVGSAQVRQRLDALAASLQSDHEASEQRRFVVESARGLHPGLRAAATAVFGILLALGAVVLLLACANVASLLLARGLARQPEMDTRVALGATPARLVASHLADAAVLAALGIVPGVLLAGLVLHLVSSVRPALDVPIGLDLALESRVVMAAVAVGALSALAAGMLPALRAARRVRSGSSAGRRYRDRRTGRLQRALLVGQLSATMGLMAGGLLLLKSLAGMASLDPGFDRDRILTVEANRPDTTDVSRYWSDVRERVRDLSGVESAAMGLFVHLGGRADQRQIAPLDAPEGAWPLGPVHYSVVDPDFFAVIGTRLEAGRTFDAGGAVAGQAIVNRALVERLWPGSPPNGAVGRSFRMTDGGSEARRVTVVGVTETLRYRRLNEPPTPFVYLPWSTDARPDGVLHVRVAEHTDPGALLVRIRDALRALDPSAALTIRRMADHRTVAVSLAGLLRSILLAGGAMGLAIAAVGVFGLVHYDARLRLRELAVRMAVGASGPRLRRAMVVRALSTAAWAGGLGSALALIAGRAVRAFLYGVSPTDPPTLGLVVVSTAGVVVLAAWIPARRATTTLHLTELLHDQTTHLTRPRR